MLKFVKPMYSLAIFLLLPCLVVHPISCYARHYVPDIFNGFYASFQVDLTRRGFQDVYVSYSPRLSHIICLPSYEIFPVVNVIPSIVVSSDLIVYMAQSCCASYPGYALNVYDIGRGVFIDAEYFRPNEYPARMYLYGSSVYICGFSMSGSLNNVTISIFLLKYSLKYHMRVWKTSVVLPKDEYWLLYQLFLYTSPYFPDFLSMFSYDDKIYVLETYSLLYIPKLYVFDSMHGSLLNVSSIPLPNNAYSFFKECAYLIRCSLSYSYLYITAVPMQDTYNYHPLPSMLLCYKLPDLFLTWYRIFPLPTVKDYVLTASAFPVMDFYDRLIVPSYSKILIFDGDGDSIANISIPGSPCPHTLENCIASTSFKFIVVMAGASLYIFTSDLKLVSSYTLDFAPQSSSIIIYALETCRNAIFIAFAGVNFNGIMLLDFTGRIVWARYFSYIVHAALVGHRIFVVLYDRILVYEC